MQPSEYLPNTYIYLENRFQFAFFSSRRRSTLKMKIFSLAFAVLRLANLIEASYINYTAVTGYFMQDEASTNAETFVYVRKFHENRLYSPFR